MTFEEWWKTVSKPFEGHVSGFKQAAELIAKTAWDAGYNEGVEHHKRIMGVIE